MKYITRITPTAAREWQQSIDFYNKQEKGLGKLFNNEVKRILKEIKVIPKAGSFMYDKVRYRVLKTYPYIIIYEIIDEDSVTIYRIFNSNRSPFWLD